MSKLNIIQLILTALVIYVMVFMPLPDTEPKYPFISHEHALMICDDLGLTYDYEAEGYDAEDFCIMTEAQAE